MVVSLPILLAALPVIQVALNIRFPRNQKTWSLVRTHLESSTGARSGSSFARNLGSFPSPPAHRLKLGRRGLKWGGRLLFVSVLHIPLRNRVKNGFDLKGSQVGPRFQHQRDNARDVRTSKAVSG